MKKGEKLFLSLFILSLVFLVVLVINSFHSVSALNPYNLEDPLGIGINAEDIPTNPEDLTNQSISYLKAEWVKILEKSQLTQILQQLDPIFLVLIGSSFSWSWLFFVSLAMFFILFRWFYWGFGFVPKLEDKGWLRFIISSIIMIFLGYSRLLRYAASWFIYLAEKSSDNLGIRIAIIVIMIVIAFFLSNIIDSMRGNVEKKTEKKKILDEAKEKLKIKTGKVKDKLDKTNDKFDKLKERVDKIDQDVKGLKKGEEDSTYESDDADSTYDSDEEDKTY